MPLKPAEAIALLMKDMFIPGNDPRIQAVEEYSLYSSFLTYSAKYLSETEPAYLSLMMERSMEEPIEEELSEEIFEYSLRFSLFDEDFPTTRNYVYLVVNDMWSDQESWTETTETWVGLEDPEAEDDWNPVLVQCVIVCVRSDWEQSTDETIRDTGRFLATFESWLDEQLL